MASSDTDNGGYRVLARKYRPRTFDQLIGQEVMVRTLANAFASGRIAQGYMLTGVRGVGKTTTARLIARALNYTLADKPTIDMPEEGEHCAAILQSRHVDVIEMDAASHTSVANIREIIDQVRYRPVSARYKVYIIDEIHMLSPSAFNALLKTLEEPPEHVKFIFATTEIRKVPVTVLSRCQRFDLRRVAAERLAEHLAWVCEREKVEAEEEALMAIAFAAEGSVRDALSLLDQAMALGGDVVKADDVRAMLGLADGARIATLLEKLMAGDAAAALEELAGLHDLGAEPAMVLTDLAAFVHQITRHRVLGPDAPAATLGERERAVVAALADKLAMPELTRAWQMLLKGIDEVRAAGRPLAAAEMVLIRLAHAARLPDPADLVRRLSAETSGAAPGAQAPAPPPGKPVAQRPPPETAGGPTAALPQAAVQAQPLPGTLEELAALASERRDVKLKTLLERFVRPISCAPGRLELAAAPGAPADLAQQLAARLKAMTGARWAIALGDPQRAGPSIEERRREQRDSRIRQAMADEDVKQVLAHFPDAKILDVRPRPAREDEAEE